MQANHPPPAPAYTLIYCTKQWPLIRPRLLSISHLEFSLKALLQFISQNAKTYSKDYKEQKLSALLQYSDTDVLTLFAKMAKAVLDFEEVYSRKDYVLPVFKTGKVFEWSYTKQEMVVLVSLMCFCLTINQKLDELAHVYNFAIIFGKEEVKTRTILLYLEHELGKVNNEIVTIRRVKQTHPQTAQSLLQCNTPLCQILLDSEGGIENYYGAIKIDFANKFIGGGSLKSPKSQEEIMFINRPELYTSMLFCQRMQPTEALAFIGFKKYFKEKGYASKVQYAGLETYKYKLDAQNRAEQYVVGIDAIPYPKHQRSEPQMLREINKALAGFRSVESQTVATGNWGCGVFKGDVQLKFLLQWIACSVSMKKMVYCSFGNKKLQGVDRIIEEMQKGRVADLWKVLITLKPEKDKDVFGQISKYFK